MTEDEGRNDEQLEAEHEAEAPADEAWDEEDGSAIARFFGRPEVRLGLVGAAILAVLVAALVVVLAGGGSNDAASQSTALPTPAPTTPGPSGGPATPPAVSGSATTTSSGLKYIDILLGTGAKPKKGQVVTVNYTGWLLADGTKFDSSLDRGKTFSFVIGAGQVIQGWDEGVSTMKVGGKRRLIVPPELGYGAAGRSPGIPADASLIFDVELLSVRAGAPSAPPTLTTPPTKTASGLQYIDITVGDGPSPQNGQTATVDYTAWLELNGSKFDSTLDTGEPFSFTVGASHTIAGWDEGLATMKVGGKRRLIIPPELGFGATGSPPIIPPNAVLIFDVELLSLK